MEWYESLNDAAWSRRIQWPNGPGRDELEPGSTEIWYAHLAYIVTSQPIIIAAADPEGWRPRICELERTHVHLGDIEEHDLETIFALMQGECWSPNGEARMLIRSLGLDHTSLSIGDVVKIGDEAWICRSVGWEQLEP